MRKAIVVVVATAVFVCVLSASSLAQSESCKVYYDTGVFCNGPGCTTTPPPGAVFSGYGVYAAFWWFWSDKCQPHQPRCQTCQRSGNSALGGHPIDLATGNTFITQTDLALPGLGGGLVLTRTWNSIPSSVYASGPHMFGLNWQSTYEDRLVYNTSDHFLTEEGGQEDETAFGLSSFGPLTYNVVAPANKLGTLKANTSNGNVTGYTLALQNGEKRVYDPTTGFLLSITDRNGNASQLTYDASNRLITVTDPASRHLNFTYQSSTSSLVTTVSSDVGVTLSYAYDTSGRLTKVTKPDNTTVSFQYDGQNRITAVLDNDGKLLESHTYDAVGHGLTSSRANGVDSLTVTYP